MRESKGKGLVAFDDLNLRIIGPGFCTLCGACEAACPVQAIKIEEGRLRYSDCSRFIDLCPICYDICPHTEPLLIETTKFVAEAPMRREGLGHYKKIVLAQATSKRLREASHSGGVVTALLTYAIDHGIIDGAVVSEAEPQAPIKLKPHIALVPDDVLSAVDSKFSPSAVAQAFGSAVHEYGRGKIAFVGVPHQILALRKLEAWEHKVMNSLWVTIGLFCLWIFSLRPLLNYLKKQFDIEISDIEKIDLTETYDVYTAKRTVKIPLSEVLPHVLPRCRTCLDYTSELADISVGGAVPLREWSTVIIRTKRGEDLFDKAVERGVIETMAVEEAPNVFTHLFGLATHKKGVALREAQEMTRENRPIPPAMSRLLLHPSYEASLLSRINVGEIMTRDVITAGQGITANQLLEIIARHHHTGYPVVDEKEELAGMITFEDMAEVPEVKRDEVFIRDVALRKPAVAYPEDSVLDAFQRMMENEIGHVVIVDKENPKKILGILSRTDIMHTLWKALITTNL